MKLKCMLDVILGTQEHIEISREFKDNIVEPILKVCVIQENKNSLS